MYLEQEILWNMMNTEAFHLYDPILAFMGFSFVGFGMLIIMGILAFILFRMAHNEKEERKQIEERRRKE